MIELEEDIFTPIRISGNLQTLFLLKKLVLYMGIAVPCNYLMDRKEEAQT